MEKFNISYNFRTEGDAFHNHTKNKKIPEKIFSNKREDRSLSLLSCDVSWLSQHDESRVLCFGRN